jgi:uncharacterized cupredoxin-like copper-binding protein
VPHEFSLGTEKELKEHYEVMKKFPNMEHEEANKISLKPGKQGEVIWRFTKAGAVNFACSACGALRRWHEGPGQGGSQVTCL